MAKQTTKKSTKPAKKTEPKKNLIPEPEIIGTESIIDTASLREVLSKPINSSIFKIFKCQLISFWSKGVKIVSLTETSNKNHKIDLVFNPEDKDADIFEKGKNYKLEISEI